MSSLHSLLTLLLVYTVLTKTQKGPIPNDAIAPMTPIKDWHLGTFSLLPGKNWKNTNWQFFRIRKKKFFWNAFRTINCFVIWLYQKYASYKKWFFFRECSYRTKTIVQVFRFSTKVLKNMRLKCYNLQSIHIIGV